MASEALYDIQDVVICSACTKRPKDVVEAPYNLKHQCQQSLHERCAIIKFKRHHDS